MNRGQAEVLIGAEVPVGALGHDGGLGPAAVNYHDVAAFSLGSQLQQ